MINSSSLVLAATTLPWIDLGIVVIFLVGMAWMGAAFAGKNKDTEEYFLGGRSFPGWAIGLSMVSTTVSSITFIALPAAAYAGDYRLITPNLMYPVAALVAVVVFIPMYRRFRITTAFEYLEKRFGPLVRLYAAATFLLTQLVRVGLVLYLVSTVVATLTGLPILLVVVVGGISICFYTVLGGMDAVIWTDVAQTFILLAGGLAALVLILVELPGGLGQVLEVGWEQSKFGLGPIEWSLNDRTFFTMMIVGLVGFLSDLVGNQNMVQRYLSAKSDREAKKATIFSAILTVPTWLFFFFLGTSIYVFYQVFPDASLATMNPEEVISHFLLTQIPVGLTGVIVAGCLAAAMSTLDSSINAFSSVAVTDFVRRYTHRDRDETFYVRAAKWVSAGVGALMIITAIGLHFMPRESMMDLNVAAGSLLGGCLLGIYLLGFFVVRVDNRALLAGLAVALVANVYLSLNQFGLLPAALEVRVHPYWTRILINVVVLVVPLVIAIFRRPATLPGAGLTFQSIRRERRATKADTILESIP